MKNIKSHYVPTAFKFFRRSVNNDFFWEEINGTTQRVKKSVGTVYINIPMRYEKYKLKPLAMLSYLLLKKVCPNRQRDKKVTNKIYIMDYKRSVPQLVSWKTNESIAIRIIEKVWLTIIQTLRT